MNLVIESYIKDFSVGCCPAEVYAIVRQGDNALRLITGTWQFDTFAKASTNDFAIVLSEHAQLSLLYSATILDANLSWPIADFYEEADLEIWYQNTGSPYLRDNSVLKDVRKVFWTTDGLQDYPPQFAKRYIPDATIAYDQINEEANIVAWLNEDGLKFTDTDQMTAAWKAQDGSDILSVGGTQMPGVPGIWVINASVISLVEDTATALEISVRITGGATYTKVFPVALFD